jgi:hypothetical protein
MEYVTYTARTALESERSEQILEKEQRSEGWHIVTFWNDCFARSHPITERHTFGLNHIFNRFAK